MREMMGKTEVAVAEQAERKKEFLRNGWQYEKPESVFALAETIAQRTDLITAEEMLEIWRTQGGKAFGLKICELMETRDSTGRLTVPTWHPYDRNHPENYDDWYTRSEFGLLVRSSSANEDWLDPRGGVEPTTRFDDLTRKRSRKRIMLKPEVPYIIQEKKNGFGLVVDIAYSDLLGKVVARVGSGRKIGNIGDAIDFGNDYTSPTSDAESSLGIWDIETGQELMERESFGHRTLLDEENGFDFPELTQSLYAKVRELGIDFGVELELVVDPKDLNKWYLVQIRPSPGTLRGEVDSSVEGQELVETSLCVNRVFEVQNNLELIDRDKADRVFSFRAQNFSRAPLDERTMQYIEAERKFATRDSSVVALFADNLVIDLRVGHAYTIGAYMSGADAQITPGAIKPNMHHDRFCGASCSEVFEYVNQRIGTVSLSREKIWNLSRRLPLKVRIVSDGLVAKIYGVK